MRINLTSAMPQTVEQQLRALGVTDAERTPCEVWTRVMGYHRPVSNFNPGKQAEHAERRHYEEAKANLAP